MADQTKPEEFQSQADPIEYFNTSRSPCGIRVILVFQSQADPIEYFNGIGRGLGGSSDPCFNPKLILSSTSTRNTNLLNMRRLCFNPKLILSSTSTAFTDPLRLTKHSFNPKLILSSTSTRRRRGAQQGAAGFNPKLILSSTSTWIVTGWWSLVPTCFNPKLILSSTSTPWTVRPVAVRHHVSIPS